MRKFTVEEKRNGELAVRGMSKKAQAFYNGTDPLAVYEYDTEDGRRYAYDGGIGTAEDLTFEEIERIFEEYQDLG